MNFRNSKKQRIFATVVVVILVASMVLSVLLAAFV